MAPARLKLKTWKLAVLLGDLYWALAAFLVAFLIRIYVPLPFTLHLMPEERIFLFTSFWWVVLAAQIVTLYIFGFYDPPRPQPALEAARRLGVAVFWQGVGLVSFFFLIYRAFPRSVLLIFLALNFLAVLVWRGWLDRLYRAPERRVAIVGTGPEAEEVAQNINRYHWYGLRVVGHVPSPSEPGSAEPPTDAPHLGPRLGTLEDLPDLLARRIIDDVVIAGNTAPWQTRLIDRLSASRPAHASVLLLPGPFESLIGRMRYRWIHDLPIIEVVRESEWRISYPIKRGFDLVAGSLMLIVSLPLLLVCAVAAKLSSPGPALFRQMRVGRGQRKFSLLKLRTMVDDAESGTGEVRAGLDDPRITAAGRVLRRFRFDELPQLLNVLRGDMSLVGPRPERPGFVARYLEEVPGYAERFSVPPGMTGLAQIHGDYYSSPHNKLRYDLAYIANWSLWLDLAILLRTLKIVLTTPPDTESAPGRLEEVGESGPVPASEGAHAGHRAAAAAHQQDDAT